MRKTKISLKQLKKDLEKLTGGRRKRNHRSQFGNIRERITARAAARGAAKEAAEAEEPYDIQRNPENLTPEQLRVISAKQVAHMREQGQREVEKIKNRNAQLLLEDKEARRLRMENVYNSLTQIPDFRTRSIIMNQIFEDAVDLVDAEKRKQILEELYNQAKKEEANEANEKTSRPV